MDSVKVISVGKDNYAVIVCQCGCGLKRLQKLPKYFSITCYGAALSKRNQERKNKRATVDNDLRLKRNCVNRLKK
jgi:DNA topoisomerase VI subunit B